MQIKAEVTIPFPGPILGVETECLTDPGCSSCPYPLPAARASASAPHRCSTEQCRDNGEQLGRPVGCARCLADNINGVGCVSAPWAGCQLCRGFSCSGRAAEAGDEIRAPHAVGTALASLPIRSWLPGDVYEHSGLSAAWERCGFSSVTAVTMGMGSSQVEFPAWVTCSPPTALSSPLPPWLSASLGLGWSVALCSASSLTFCPLHLSGMGEIRSQKTLFCCLLDIGKPAAGVLPFRLISVLFPAPPQKFC